jgi:YggT family protein
MSLFSDEETNGNIQSMQQAKTDARLLDMVQMATAISVVVPAVAHADADMSVVIAKPLIDTFVNIMSIFFLARTVISWYPKTDLKAFPYNIAVWPTEPFLAPAREILPPAFGVDVSSIAWLMVLSFIREILTGQQGILTIMTKA